jgi:hypothetical protein
MVKNPGIYFNKRANFARRIDFLRTGTPRKSIRDMKNHRRVLGDRIILVNGDAPFRLVSRPTRGHGPGWGHALKVGGYHPPPRGVAPPTGTMPPSGPGYLLALHCHYIRIYSYHYIRTFTSNSTSNNIVVYSIILRK